MALALVIAFSGSQDSGATTPAAVSAGTLSRQARELTASPRVAPEKCSARKAVRFYARRIAYWRDKMGAASVTDRSLPRGITRLSDGCPRYLSKVLRAKAYALRREYARWHAYMYDWRSWLPAKWVRIAICETGLNWRHSNSSYEGAFGFALSSWDAFVPYADRKAGPYPPNAYLATPRQQYEVALAIWRRYGLSGWGCRAA